MVERWTVNPCVVGSTPTGAVKWLIRSKVGPMAEDHVILVQVRG